MANFSDLYNVNSPKARMSQVGQAIDALAIGKWIDAGTTGGTTTAYTASLLVAPSAYYDGMLVTLKVNATNTGATTLNINSLGAKNVYKEQGATALVGKEMLILSAYLFRYDSALNAGSGGWIILNPDIAITTSYAPTITCSGSMTAASTTYYEYAWQLVGQFLQVAICARTTLGGTAATQVYIPLPTQYTYVTHNVNTGYNWAGFQNSTVQVTSGIVFCDNGARLRFTLRPEVNYTLGIAQFNFIGQIRLA